MIKSYRSKLVGVFGYPVDENPSVVMNEAAFRAAGLDWRYITMQVSPEDLRESFLALRAMNFEGVNLTIPHKIAAMEYVDQISDAAKLIGAINIVVRRGDLLAGDNTDGKGLVDSLADNNIQLSGKRVVVLGAGGASRAICVECALAGCKSIVVINRTKSKAQDIVEIINKNTACKASAIGWQKKVSIPECDILVNATSVGLSSDQDCPNIIYEDIKSGMFVQDVITNPADTLFLKKARSQGASTGNGLGMLVRQGAIGFKLWTGQDADVQVMENSLMEEFRI